MKLLKERSRIYKNRPYFKYKVNIPAGAIQRGQFKEGEDLIITAKPGSLTLFQKHRTKQEFDGIRAQLYKECLKEFPHAREQDISFMKTFLKPQKGERILEIGAGSGFFSRHIAKAIGKKGILVVSDPSLDQLEEVRQLRQENIKTIQFVQFGSATVDFEEKKVDAVWSFGAMHHMFQKNKSFENLSNILKPDGRVIIGDVFCGSTLARHFDSQVARYCITGHEVSFWSKEYAQTICAVNGFEEPKFIDVNCKWKFKKRKDIGVFLYKLHAMTKTTPQECLRVAEEILGIKKETNHYILNWPMTFIITKKK